MAGALALDLIPILQLAPAMRAALAKETDPAVKASLRQTIAQVDLGSTDPARRIASIEAMANSSHRRRARPSR